VASTPDQIVNFFVIGAQKGGTTALDMYLREVPGIQMASQKEPHHFDDESIDWSTNASDNLHRFFDWQPGVLVVRGEATPIYSYWPNALERLHRYNPSAKLIMCLRHPGFRAYSHWHMETQRGDETMSFAAAVSPIGRLRVSPHPTGVHRTFSYVDRGFYSYQIERALALFPRTQIHFLRSDQHWNQPEQTRRCLLSFLGIVPNDYSHTTAVLPRITKSMHDLTAQSFAEIASLSAMYADDIRRTEALSGITLSDWLDDDYREPMATA